MHSVVVEGEGRKSEVIRLRSRAVSAISLDRHKAEAKKIVLDSFTCIAIKYSLQMDVTRSKQ